MKYRKSREENNSLSYVNKLRSLTNIKQNSNRFSRWNCCNEKCEEWGRHGHCFISDRS
jgi:hypothetical protein